MDGFHVTKPASGPRSSHLIDGFQIAIIKTQTKDGNKNERNKVFEVHVHVWTLRLIPKVHIHQGKICVRELFRKRLIPCKARKEIIVKYSQSGYSSSV